MNDDAKSGATNDTAFDVLEEYDEIFNKAFGSTLDADTLPGVVLTQLEAVIRADERARLVRSETRLLTQHGLLDATADMLEAHDYADMAEAIRKTKKEMPDCPVVNL